MKRLLIPLSTVLALVVLAVHPVPARAVAFVIGDLFVGTTNGNIEHRSGTTGALIETLNTTLANQYDTGMCFDLLGNLYATDIYSQAITKFNSSGGLVNAKWVDTAADPNNPESCIWNAANTTAFVGGPFVAQIRGYSGAGPATTGTETTRKTVASAGGTGGTDWVDLAADQCTVYYTNESNIISRYNMCTSTQLPAFATVSTAAACYAVRIRPTTLEVMVACSDGAHRLSPTGVNLQTYSAQGGLFALNLDPNGISYWTAGPGGGTVWKVNIITGTVEAPSPITTNAPTWGLAVFGELTAGGGGPGVCPTEQDGKGDIKDDKSDNHTKDLRDVKVNVDTDDNLCEEQEQEEQGEIGDQDQQEVDTHDNRDGSDFKSSKIDSISLSQQGKKMTVLGSGTHSGTAVTFVMVAVDNGPSVPGFFSLQLSDGYNVAGSLIDGAIHLN
jgi:hypothetical protein